MPELLLNGPDGRLEARYNPVKDNPHAPIALILHPHPLHGGTMYNKVVHMMNQSFVANGFATLRFNFRGVGKSQGRYNDGVGETTDAIAALEWLQTMHKSPSQMWVAGFSFGAWVAMQVLMRRPELSGFVAISPPANMYDFSFLAPCPCGGLVVQGDTDKIVHEPAVNSLVKRLREQRGRTAIDYRVIEGANHFYQGHEDHFQAQLSDYLSLTQNYRMAAE